MLTETANYDPFQEFVTIDTGSGALLAAIALLRRFKKSDRNFTIHCIIDPLFAPYGLKPDDLIKRRLVGAIQYADYNISLQSIKIIACNTASQFKDDVRAYLDLTLGKTISIIDPTIDELRRLGKLRARSAEQLLKTGIELQPLCIAIFATKSTTDREYILNRAKSAVPCAEVTGVACLHLATLIDNGGIIPIMDNVSHEEVVKARKRTAKDLASLLKASHPMSLLELVKDENSDYLPLITADVERNVSGYIHPKNGPSIPQGAQVVAVLACTHFPKVAEAFSNSFERHGGIKPWILNQHELVSAATLKMVGKRGLKMVGSDQPRIIIHTTGTAVQARTMLENLLIDDMRKHDNAIVDIRDVEVREIEIPEMPLADFGSRALEEHKKRQNSIWSPGGP